MLTPQDKELLNQKGITEDQLAKQIARFKNGFSNQTLCRAATIGDGIRKLSDSEISHFIDKYDSSDIDVLKFVPASGAASRMFKELFGFLEEGFDGESNARYAQFFKNLKNFAFFQDLKSAFEQCYTLDIEEAIQKKDKRVLSCLLEEEALGYGHLPKGLLKFHSDEEGNKTPVQEHIAEGSAYASKGGKVKIHLTVSSEHQQAFDDHVNGLLSASADKNRVEISYSTQKVSTDTVAVDMQNEPFRTDSGELLFRPAGHGALLANLDQLEAYIVFIKNIDNVVPDRLKAETIKYKKALAGVLLTFQEKAFSLLERHERGVDIKEEGSSLLKEMGLEVSSDSSKEIAARLNRPIRVCGMVKNEGEPGGGPFWVSFKGGEALQIVESAQVNHNDEEQATIFQNSTHFNPVDLVCGLKNREGHLFDLLAHRDENTGFITEKSFQGRKLKAMELPGLWNGAMADWNTIFVEVPLITFNPVKTVFDLLKENHQ